MKDEKTNSYQQNIHFIMKFGKCSEENAKKAYEETSGDVARAIILVSTK